MQKQNLEFNFLNALEKGLIQRRGAASAFAGVDKSARVPFGIFQIADNLCEHFFLCVGFRELDSAFGNFWKSWMIADAMKPIFGVAVVGFASMHDGVNERAIRSFDFLRDAMRFVE